jgi:hypothetical protein
LKIAAHDIPHKVDGSTHPVSWEPEHSNRDDDRADKAGANGCDCCAETFHSRGLREIAFAPEAIAVIQPMTTSYRVMCR